MLVKVAIHESQFPETVQEELKRSLRTRQINHKFHYQSYRQMEKWRALHRAYAPLEKEPGAAHIYEKAFEAATEVIGAAPVQVAGLCCGYAEKETRLLQLLQKGSEAISFLACDGSVPMVLQAAQSAAKVIPAEKCHRLVCDLQSASDLAECLLAATGFSGRRLFSFFGSIHNFEPELIFPRLDGLLQPDDVLLFSANLVPGPDSETAIEAIKPQYENALTFDWLFQFLSDLGFFTEDGKVRVRVESCPCDRALPRLALYFEVARKCAITLGGEEFAFRSGEAIRLFYSYRYTPEQISDWLSRNHLALRKRWVSHSSEEGVFLCGKG